MYVNDFGRSGKVKQVITNYRKGKSYPIAMKDVISKPIPSLQKKFLEFADYQGKTIEDIFSKEELQSSIHLNVYQTASCILWNDAGKINLQELPWNAQLSSVYSIFTEDINGDGLKDILLGGIYNALSSSVVAGGANAPVTASISGSITSANVLSALDSLVNAIPNTVYGKEDVMIYVPTNVVKAYQQALAGGAQGANGWNNTMNVGEKPLNFNGIEMAYCPGLASSAMVAAQKSNLYFGTGLLSDHNEVRVLDMANLDGSQNYRIIMRYTAGTQYGIGTDIAIYKNY
jgi:hypothetical protein